MSKIEELIKELPNIILFLVTGFCCVRMFHFVALKEYSQEVEHALSVSLVVGYLIVKVMNCIPWTISPEIDSIGITLTGIFIGYIVGRIYISGYLDKLCDKLKIQSTTNRYIWNDLYDKEYPMEVKVEMDNNKVYKGFVHYIEAYNNTPNISIVGYELETNKKNETTNVGMVENSRVILLNLENAKSVEIIYSTESNKVGDIIDLASNIIRN